MAGGLPPTVRSAPLHLPQPVAREEAVVFPGDDGAGRGILHYVCATSAQNATDVFSGDASGGSPKHLTVNPQNAGACTNCALSASQFLNASPGASGLQSTTVRALAAKGYSSFLVSTAVENQDTAATPVAKVVAGADHVDVVVVAQSPPEARGGADDGGGPVTGKVPQVRQSPSQLPPPASPEHGHTASGGRSSRSVGAEDIASAVNIFSNLNAPTTVAPVSAHPTGGTNAVMRDVDGGMASSNNFCLDGTGGTHETWMGSNVAGSGEPCGSEVGSNSPELSRARNSVQLNVNESASALPTPRSTMGDSASSDASLVPLLPKVAEAASNTYMSTPSSSLNKHGDVCDSSCSVEIGFSGPHDYSAAADSSAAIPPSLQADTVSEKVFESTLDCVSVEATTEAPLDTCDIPLGAATLEQATRDGLESRAASITVDAAVFRGASLNEIGTALSFSPTSDTAPAPGIGGVAPGPFALEIVAAEGNREDQPGLETALVVADFGSGGDSPVVLAAQNAVVPTDLDKTELAPTHRKIASCEDMSGFSSSNKAEQTSDSCNTALSSLTLGTRGGSGSCEATPVSTPQTMTAPSEVIAGCASIETSAAAGRDALSRSAPFDKTITLADRCAAESRRVSTNTREASPITEQRNHNKKTGLRTSFSIEGDDDATKARSSDRGDSPVRASSGSVAVLRKKRTKTLCAANRSTTVRDVAARSQGVIQRDRRRSSTESGANPAGRVGEEMHVVPNCTPVALREVAENLDAKKVEELIAGGVSVNTPHKTAGGYTTLLHALCSKSGDAQRAEAAKIMARLLQACANVNPRSSEGLTPLMCACMWKNKEAAKLLVDWNADVTPRDDTGYDCLLWSLVLDLRRPSGILHTDVETSSVGSLSSTIPRLPNGCVTEKCLSDNSRRSCDRKWSEFSAPMDGDTSAEVVRLVFHGRAQSVLMKQEEETKVARFPEVFDQPQDDEAVIENWALGISIGVNDSHASTKKNWKAVAPLLLAVRHRNCQAASVLLEFGAKPNCLHDAVLSGCLPMVQILLSAGADPTERDEQGDSSMDLALRLTDDQKIMDALREAAKDFGRPMCTEERSSAAHSKRDKSKYRPRTTQRSSVHPSRLGSVKGTLVSMQDAFDKRRRSSHGSSIVRAPGNLARGCEPVCRILSSQCQWLINHRAFQTIMFSCLICSLFVSDFWILVDAEADVVLDVLLVICLTCFLIEFFAQIVGLRWGYMFTFFFFMDLVGACSLLLDLSKFQTVTGTRDRVGGNAVIMRAARAARLGARAGRFSRLLKLLRFLHPNGSSDDDEKTQGIAKGLSSLLVLNLSTRVSCLIIVLVMVLPLFSLFCHPTEDWGMQVWTNQLADAFEGGDQIDTDEVIENFRVFYAPRNYMPHSYRLGQSEVVLWKNSRKSLQASHELKVVSGDLVVSFDFRIARQVEAGMNLLMIIVTIGLMLSFSLLISDSVSKIAVRPLECILDKVRTIGSTLYSNVEHMHNEIRGTSQTRNSISNVGVEGETSEEADETALLECVVRKLAALSEITTSKTEPGDLQALQYMGVTKQTCHAIRTTHGMAGLDQSQNRRLWSMQSSVLEIRVDGEVSSRLICSWDFETLTLTVPHGCSVCGSLIGNAACKIGGIDAEKLQEFTDEAARGYLPGPKYHCWAHAVDVTHVLFMMFLKCNGGGLLISALEEVALLVAAVFHDAGHFGVNNDFLVQTSHELAMRYNDRSPLENMSCAKLFEVVKKPSTTIFESLTAEQFKEVRTICVEAILQTDNSCHVNMVKRLQMFAEVNSSMLLSAQELYLGQSRQGDRPSARARGSTDGDEVHGSTANSWPPPELVDAMWESEPRQLLRNTFLHAADISNPTRPFKICKAWASCVIEEFFAQGDLEKQLGLPVSPLNDREKTNFPFSQVGFIEFFVAPLAFATVRILAPLDELVERLLANARRWAEDWRSDVTPSEEDFHKIEERLHRLEERSPIPRGFLVSVPRNGSGGRDTRSSESKASPSLRKHGNGSASADQSDSGSHNGNGGHAVL
eukprot:TRINITY_DN27486_c0_g1_i1.p1 TRINITY_DN27486_c0_g1~~TRINITY_DN27486_c0_g1_i1.p1  ORF type:complete len:2024 (-),score=310.73 TRINITY_DN27486_c0_g1_i1:149-6220(-)